MKLCPRCALNKPTNAFGKNKNRADGLNGWCKACLAQWYLRHRSEQITKAQQWASNNRTKRKVVLKRYHSNHRDQGQARNAVSEAVEKGILPPAKTQVCTVCGDSAMEYHHHKGYEPKHCLDVVPLCTACHGQTQRGLTHAC